MIHISEVIKSMNLIKSFCDTQECQCCPIREPGTGYGTDIFSECGVGEPFDKQILETLDDEGRLLR